MGGLLVWAWLKSPTCPLRTGEEALQLQGEAAVAANFLDSMEDPGARLATWTGQCRLRCNNIIRDKPQGWDAKNDKVWDWKLGNDFEVNIKEAKEMLTNEEKQLGYSWICISASITNAR